jgi:NADPH:quinone reductase
MKAWVKRGSGLQLEDVPDPIPASDQLLVRVEAFSLNRGELRGVSRAADGVIPGWDVAGTVVSTGARVATFVDRGAWAEYVCVPAAQAAVVPDAVPLEVAATLPIAALTVVRAFDVAGSLLGKSILVTGGSGGVGQFAIQLGTLAGAHVTAVSSRDIEAHAVVKTIDEAKGPFDLILESVGGRSLATAIDRVARGGVVVTIGNSSEEDTTFNARTLYAKGGARIYGLLIFEEVASRRTGARDLERLMALIEAGKLHAPIEVTRSWTDLPAVLAGLENRTFAGKAVLTVGHM